MGVATLAPESYTQNYEWLTDILTGRDGDEQRIALRRTPRETFSVSYLADNDEEIQSWRYQFLRDLDTRWALPIWPEAEKVTAAVVAGSSTVDADYTMMDDSFDQLILLHPDGETYEIFSPTSRTATTATRTGVWANDYPRGSVVVPLRYSFVNNRSGYQAGQVNSAKLSLEFLPSHYLALEGKGAAALDTYRGFPVLDRRPSTTSEVFEELVDRIDYGHKVQVMGDPGQSFANITSGREYDSDGNADRQWWKLFLATVRGQQKPFYASTYRPDLTISEQPIVGATTIIVLDSATMVGGWADSPAHQDLSIVTSDGVTQRVTVSGAVNNGDGTHTVTFAPALTSTGITMVSHLEMLRLGSDVVSIDHQYHHRRVKLSVRTLNEVNPTA